MYNKEIKRTLICISFGAHESQTIAVDTANQAFVAGFTYSVDFPLADPFQAQKCAEGCAVPPCTDAFVLALNPSGGALLYSSYLGGSKDDYAYDLALDGQGDAYLTGETYSTDFPTTPGEYDVTLEGTKRDAFLVKVSQPSTQEEQTRLFKRHKILALPGVEKDQQDRQDDHIAHSPNCSIAKAQRLLNYQPRYTSLQGVFEAVEWMVKQQMIKIV